MANSQQLLEASRGFSQELALRLILPSSKPAIENVPPIESNFIGRIHSFLNGHLFKLVTSKKKNKKKTTSLLMTQSQLMNSLIRRVIFHHI